MAIFLNGIPVTEAAAIRRVFAQDGELAAMIELRRHFPGIVDNAKARECVRAIAGWKPRPVAGTTMARLRSGGGACWDAYSRCDRLR
jgi:hypothetical protein